MSVIGDIFGGGDNRDKELEDWFMKNVVMPGYRTERTSGFMPDEGDYDAAIEADINDIMSQLPMGMESFNADLASRGIYGAGEAPKRMYSDVIAPVARQASNAAVQGRLKYAQSYQQGRMAEENQRMQYLEYLYKMISKGKPESGNFLTDLARLGIKVGTAWAMPGAGG